MVRLITGDPIGISGVTYLCVAIRSLSCTRKNREINQLSLATYLRLAFCLLLCGSVGSQGNCVTFRVIVKLGIIVDVRYCPACNSPLTDRLYTSFLQDCIFRICNCVDNSGATSGLTVAARNFFGIRKSLRLVPLLAAGQKKLGKTKGKKQCYKSKIKIPTLYCCRKVDSCLHCTFRNGAWRPRAAFHDSVLPIWVDTSRLLASHNYNTPTAGRRGATLSATYLGGHLTFTSITQLQHTNSR